MIWIIVILGGLLIALWQYHARTRTPLPKWQTPHTLMMRIWARAIGLELGQTQREGKDPLPWALHAGLVSQVYSNLSPMDCYGMVAVCDKRLRNFRDEELIKAELARRPNMLISAEDARRIFTTAADGQYNFLLACMIVAGVVEERYGKEERGRYLVDVLLGNAR